MSAARPTTRRHTARANSGAGHTPPEFTERPWWTGRQRAQALSVEVAVLVLPLCLLLIFGLLGVARLTAPLLGLSAVAREAARSGALATDPVDAQVRARSRADQVAADYGLRSVDLQVDVSGFGPPGEVQVDAATTVVLADVPVVHLGSVRLHRMHAEVVDPYRSTTLAP